MRKMKGKKRRTRKKRMFDKQKSRDADLFSVVLSVKVLHQEVFDAAY